MMIVVIFAKVEIFLQIMHDNLNFNLNGLLFV